MAKLVVLDPGHGGEDPGAGGHGLSEARLTLKIAKRARRALTDRFDVRVRLTRTNDSFVGLSERARFANDLDADYFVSIHINSGGGTGYEDFVHTSAGPNSETARRHVVVHAAVAGFMERHGVPDRGRKRADFVVLRETTMPAILTENLFIDTQGNAGLLGSNRFIGGLAKAHAKGIGAALGLPARSGAGAAAVGAARVHRELRLTTPMMEGPDIKVLQRAVNRTKRRFPRILRFDRLDVDGKLGEKTLQATFKSAHAMGLIRRALDRIQDEKVIPEAAQELLRRPERRSEAQRKRGRRRRAKLREQLDRRPSLADVHLTLRSGAPHWGGANDVLSEFVEPFMVRRGLPIGSGKRTPAEHAAVGGAANSDHLTTKRIAAARDFPTFSGEDEARALAHALGFSSWQPNSFTPFTVSVGGRTFRAQVLWGAQIDHGDHVHVGLLRL